MYRFFQRLIRGEQRVSSQTYWEEFAGSDWPETILGMQVRDRFFAKQGRSISRWTLTHAGRNLVVFLKRHYHLPRWQGLLAALWPGGDWSPAMAEARNLRQAEALGVPVPRVAAAAEYVRPGGRLQSVLAVEELTDMLPLHEAVPLASQRLSATAFAEWKRGLIAEMARLTRLLHDRHWFHKDLYFCHFYMPEADTYQVPTSWVDRVPMIDFHRLARHAVTSPWWQAKDLGQLLYSSDVEGVTARDRVRFWSLARKGRSTLLASLVRRIVVLRAKTNHRHNEKRPQAPRRAA